MVGDSMPKFLVLSIILLGLERSVSLFLMTPMKRDLIAGREFGLKGNLKEAKGYAPNGLSFFTSPFMIPAGATTGIVSPPRRLTIY